MEYYRFHYLLEDLTEILEAKAKANQAQADQAKAEATKSKPSKSTFGGFKMPSLSNFKMPKLR